MMPNNCENNQTLLEYLLFVCVDIKCIPKQWIKIFQAETWDCFLKIESNSCSSLLRMGYEAHVATPHILVPL